MVASQTYVTHALYKLIAGLCCVLAVLFAWDLLRTITPGAMLFFAISLGIALWSVHAMLRQVELTPTSICVTTPFRAPQCVEFRQLVSVSENGRLNPVITLVYHPQLANGLLDLDTV